MKAFLFPGQGSQFVGMGRELMEKRHELVEKTSEILGFDIKRLILEGPEEELKKTENTQVAIYLVSYLAFLETGETPDYVAGHSLGEYTALTAAGVVDFEDGIRIVRKRGELMAQAREGSMLAVIGLDKKTIEEVLEAFKDVVIANENSPVQYVLSGEKEAVEKVGEELKKRGAKKVVPLKVSGAFHSPLMEEAKNELAKFLKTVEFKPARIPIVQNVTAKAVTDPTEIKENLIHQMTGKVKWVDTLNFLFNTGVREFVEVGPGKVLTGLVRKTLKDVKVKNTGC